MLFAPLVMTPSSPAALVLTLVDPSGMIDHVRTMMRQDKDTQVIGNCLQVIMEVRGGGGGSLHVFMKVREGAGDDEMRQSNEKGTN